MECNGLHHGVVISSHSRDESEQVSHREREILAELPSRETHDRIEGNRTRFAIWNDGCGPEEPHRSYNVSKEGIIYGCGRQV